MSKEPPRQNVFLEAVQLQAIEAEKQVLSDHRKRVLLHQQKVAALVECATDYAHDPRDPQSVANLLRIALAFAENV